MHISSHFEGKSKTYNCRLSFLIFKTLSYIALSDTQGDLKKIEQTLVGHSIRNKLVQEYRILIHLLNQKYTMSLLNLNLDFRSEI